MDAFSLIFAKQCSRQSGDYKRSTEQSDRSPGHERACILVQSNNFKANFARVGNNWTLFHSLFSPKPEEKFKRLKIFVFM